MLRLIRLTALVVAMAFLVVPGALSATPAQIYKDYADNGRLDGTYSKSDLDRALKDAVLQGYGSPNVTQGFAPAASAAAGRTAGLPFTGLDLTLMAVGGATLLAAGLGVRRLAKTRK
jgi:hypothetical protein